MPLRWSGRPLLVKLLIAGMFCVVLLLGPVHYYFTVLHAGEYGHWNYEDALGWYIYALAATGAVLLLVTVAHYAAKIVRR